MFAYLFILGRVSIISTEEIFSLLKTQKIHYILETKTDEILQIKTEEKLDLSEFMKILGGTIKIAQVLSVVETEENVCSLIIGSLKSSFEKRKKFGISVYGTEKNNLNLNNLCKKIKVGLEGEGFESRYILGQEKQALSSVVVVKQKLVEFILVAFAKKITVAITEAVQDFENWNKRDFERPFSDPKNGMLPPKVARMMINLAGVESVVPKVKILVDPFCGCGTIIQEAVALGFFAIGTDINDKYVNFTEKNLDWFCQNFTTANNYKVQKCDALHLTSYIKEKVDLIVTEPYLGPNFDQNRPIKSIEYLKRIIKGLDKLYIGCLREWQNILKPGGSVVITFPSFVINKTEYFVKKAVDNCEKLGYSIQTGPIAYSRPKAMVKRNIYKLVRK